MWHMVPTSKEANNNFDGKIDDFLRQTLESSSLCFGIFAVNSDNAEMILLSKGFKASFNKNALSNEEKIFGIALNNVHKDDIESFKEKASSLINEGDDLDLYFRFHTSSDSLYRSIHALGRRIELEGKSLLFVWYNDLATMDDDTFIFDERAYDNTVSIIKNYYDDELTGLPRMANFVHHVQELLSTPYIDEKNYVLLAFDLTGMKAFNMKYGFENGNRLIISIADILKKYFEIQSISRFGEDHFYVLTENDEIEKTIKEIFEDVKKANDGNTLPIRVGIYKDKITDISVACDKAKTAADVGRHSYISHFTYFDENLSEEIEKRDFILNNLQNAIEKGHIQPYYQPIVRTLNNKVADEEALARWKDPEKGLLNPADFISILEDARIIYRLDLCILDCVLADLKKKKEKGQYLTPVSINISRYDFESCNIVELVSKRVKDSGFPSDLIIIEITESAAFYNKALLIEQVNRFHECGFKVWVDDFGSGYSSLNSLQEFSFDGMKIDMGFLSSFKENKKTPSIIKETIKLAEMIGIDTICEGVETKEELDFLREAGCDKVQGYYFSKPNPIDYILSGQTALKRENPEERGYYREIALSSLSEPESNGDKGTIAERALSGPSVGIIEVKDNTFRLLRTTKAFKSACEMGGFISPTEEYDGGYAFARTPDSFFSETIYRACDTGNWEETSYHSKHRITTFFFRLISTNPVTKASSIMCIMSYANKDGDKKVLRETELTNLEAINVDDFPLPVIIVELCGENSEKESLKCLSLNKAFCDLASVGIDEAKSENYLETVFDKKKEWKKLIKQVLSARKPLKGEIFHEPSRLWMNFIISPCLSENCVCVTILQDSSSLSLFEKRAINCDDEAYRIASLLKQDGNHSKKIDDAINEFGRSSNADEALIIELNGNVIEHCHEWNKTTFSPLASEIDEMEFCSVLAALRKRFERENYVYTKTIEELKAKRGGFYNWCRSHGVKRFLIFPLFSQERLIGLFVVNNYEINNAEFTRKLMEKLSGIFSSQISLSYKEKGKKEKTHGFSRHFSGANDLKTRTKQFFGIGKRSASENIYNDRTNIEIGRFTSAFIALLELVFTAVFIINFFVNKDKDPNNIHYESTWVWSHLALYAFAFVVNALFFIYCELYYHDKLTKVRKLSLKTHIVIDAYVLCVIAFGMFISIMDVQNGGQPITFVMMLLYTMLIFRLHPIKSIVYLLMMNVLFLILLYEVPMVNLPVEKITMGLDVGSFANIISVFALECVCSSLLYRVRMKSAAHCIVDTLSGAKCRFALQEDFKHLEGKRVVVMMLDVDDFKLLNDIHGHQAGDEVINEIGQALIKTFGIEYVYRYGGDEFLVIKKGDLFSFEKHLFNLQSNINLATSLDMNVTFSAGYKEHLVTENVTLDEVIRESDLLLYEAKKRGKNQIVKG